MLDIKINNHFYNYVLDIIDTKTYKLKQVTSNKTQAHICIIKFDNKALESIRLRKSFNYPNIIITLSYNLQKKGSIPTVTHKLVNTTRNNNLSYKDVIGSIYVDEEVSFSLNTDLCDCEKLKIL